MIRAAARELLVWVVVGAIGVAIGAGVPWCMYEADASPMSAQPPYSTVTTGYVDPTASTANGGHPAVSCDPSITTCSTALINQNTDAFQWAIAQASTAPYPWIYTPPLPFPYARGGTGHNQHYGIDINAVSNVVWKGYGTTLRQTGNLGQSEFDGVVVENGSSHIRFYGIHFSQRDMTASPVVEQTHNLSLGQGSTADDVQVIDCTFDEGYGGDSIRMFGGVSEAAGVLTRVLVARNRIDAYRDGLSWQHGTSMFSAYSNFLGPTQNLPLHHEPTSPGGNNYENVIGNVFHAYATAVAQGLSFSGVGDAQPDGVHDGDFAYNAVLDGELVAIGTLRRFAVVGNTFYCDDQSGNNTVDIEETADDVWIDGNQITNAGSDASNIRFAQRNSKVPAGLWVANNQLRNFSDHVTTCTSTFPCGGGVTSNGALREWVTHNQILYNSTGASNGADGFVGVASLSGGALYGTNVTVNDAVSGWVLDNTIRRDVLADGVTQAGLMGVGVDIERGSTGQFQGIGHWNVRGNLIDGALYPYGDQTGASLPDGPQVLAQNRAINITGSVLDQYPTTWVQDATARAESITALSGTTSQALDTTNFNICGAGSYTIADGLRGGQVHTFNANTTCASTAALTFTHCGNCTTETATTTSGNLYGSLTAVWDATGDEWWVMDKSSTVTP